MVGDGPLSSFCVLHLHLLGIILDRDRGNQIRLLGQYVRAFATKLFPILSEWLHFYGLNYYYAAFALLLTIWGMVTIKDTDRLSLVEIERIYDIRVSKSENVTTEPKRKDMDYGSLESQ